MTTDLAAAGTAAPGFRLAPELTIGSNWLSASGRAVDDDLLRWPPDLFALTDVALDRPEAYRSPSRLLPAGMASNPHATMKRGRGRPALVRLGAGATGRAVGPRRPGVAGRAGRGSDPLAELASGRAWRLCQALLTLHAISDSPQSGQNWPFCAARPRRARHRARAQKRRSVLNAWPKYMASGHPP